MKRDKHFRPAPNQSHRDIPALRFWDTIDRSQFELALSDNDKNDKYAAFLQALSDPTYARCSFPTLLRKFNISLHEAQTIYTDHMRHMGLLLLSSQLPEVMTDVAEDAKSHMKACPRCDGDKVVVFTRGNKKARKKCPECKGTGEVRMIGDKHARDLVFESVGLTKKQGPLFAMQQNFITRSDEMDYTLDPKMEKMLTLTATMLVAPPNERRAAEHQRPSVEHDRHPAEDFTSSSEPAPE